MASISWRAAFLSLANRYSPLLKFIIANRPSFRAARSGLGSHRDLFSTPTTLFFREYLIVSLSPFLVGSRTCMASRFFFCTATFAMPLLLQARRPLSLRWL